jgi:uncharacterized protein (DUF58 family)
VPYRCPDRRGPAADGRGTRLRFSRVRVRITSSGWLAISLTLLVGLAAANTGNNLLYLLTSALLALLVLSGTVAYAALLRGLYLELVLPTEWFAGEEAPVVVRLHNRRRHLASYLIQLDRGERSAIVVHVPPGHSEETILPFAFSHRGERPLGDILVTSPFPFAFFHRGGTVRLDGTALVYPAPAPLPERPPKWDGGLDGDGVSSLRGIGGDYLESRPYLPGDALGRIDWKRWGRQGQLAVKEFEEDTSPPLRLSLDSVPGPGLEARLSQLTALLLNAHREGRPVGLELGGHALGPGRGKALRGRQLRALALYPE